MDTIDLKLDREDTGYVPGEPISGRVSWDLGRSPGRMVVRLLWQTSGKGTQDTGVVAEEVYEMASLRDARVFSFPGVEGPYSFSGKLITVQWLIEAVADKGDAHAEQLLTVSPTGTEVRV